ncbi:MAG: phage tail tape measure protein [Peptostreptococcaceae bacterium]
MAQTEEIAKLAVSLSLEAQNFDKQMASINKSIKNAERDFKSAGKGVSDFEKSFIGLDAKIQKTSKQLDLYNTKLSKQKEQYTKLQGDLEATKNKLDELEQTQGRNSDAWKEQAQLVQKNAQDLTKLGTDINTTESNISKLTNELNQSQKEFEQLGNKTKSLDENLEDISRQADLTQSEFEKLGSELQTSGNYFSSLGNDMNQLSAQITSGNQKINAYDSEIKKLESTISKIRVEHSQLGNEINKTEKELTNAKSAYGENSTEALQLKQKLLQLKDEYNSLESEITQGVNSLDRYQTELNQTQAEVNQLANELLNMPFERIGSDLKSSGEAIKGVGQSMTTSVTLPLIAAGAAAVKVGVDFDSAMSSLQATLGPTKATSEAMSMLKDAAQQAGSTTSKSATESAEALNYMALAGWSVEDSLIGLMPMLRASEAAAADLGSISDLVTDSMGGLGIEVNELEGYLNKVAKTSQITNTKMDVMLEAFNATSGPAKTLGIDVSELSSTIGVLANASYKGSEGGKALSTILTRLAKPPKEAQKSLDELGVSVFDSDGKFRGLEVVLGDLSGAFGSLTQEEAMYHAKNIAGQNYISQFTAIVDGANGSMQGFTEEIRNSNGTLEEMAITMQENLGGSISEMKSAIEGSLYNAFKSMEPVLDSIISRITDLANWFNGLDAEQQKNIVTIAGVAAAMGPLLMLIGQLIIVGGNATLLFGKLSSGMSLVSAGTGGLSAVLGGLSGIALPAVAAALLLLIAKLGDNEKAILTLQEKYGGFGTFIGGVMEFISGAVQVTVGYIIELFKGGFDVIGAIIDGPGGNTVKDATARMNENLNLTMEEGMNKLLLTTTRGMSQMRNASDEQLNGTVTSMETIMDAIPNIVDGKYRTAANNLGAQLAQMDFTQISILQGMNDTTKMMFEGIRTGMTVDEASKKVEENLKQMATAGKIDADTMSKDVSSAMEQMKNQMDTKTKEGANSVYTNMDKAASDVNQATSKIQSDVNKNMNTSSTDMKNKSKEGADSISQNYGKGASDANKELSKISSDTKSNMDKSTQAIRQSGSDMYNGVKTSFSKMEQVCKQHATEMYKGVQTSAKKMADSAKTSASDMYRGVTTSTSKMANQAISDWNRIRNTYSKPIKGSVTMTKTTINKTQTANSQQLQDTVNSISSNKSILNGMQELKHTAGIIDVNGSYFNSNTRGDTSFYNNFNSISLEKTIAALSSVIYAKQTPIQITFENVNLSNDVDDLRKLAQDLAGYMSEELAEYARRETRLGGSRF